MIKDENINCTIEALILSSAEPVSVRKICEALDDVSSARVRQAVDDLNNVYLGCGGSFRIRELAGGYQMYILPDFEGPVKRLLSKQRTIRLTRPAVETLAIIAYKQPVTKIDIEHIRGVASDGVIHNLLQRKLIVISGRANAPGRPLLYKTSNEFLKFFGLNRLSDLPSMEEIEEMIKMSEIPKEQTSLPLTDDNAPEFTDAAETGVPQLSEAEIDDRPDRDRLPVMDGGNGSEPSPEPDSEEPLLEDNSAEGSSFDESEAFTAARPDEPEVITIVPPLAVEESAENTDSKLPPSIFDDFEPIPDDPPPLSFAGREPVSADSDPAADEETTATADAAETGPNGTGDN